MKNDNLDHENRPVKYGITPDELRLIQQRRIEAHADRETNEALNLLRAVKLGEALREARE
ncbi:hypothetical protein [Pseudomonas aeruginosa]|uniref:hypothetical protein n=1 Tax=Pseudomonas aeruginosa TaxID=287 RepID=UPI0021F2368B|nr:hypothetical protein [Pseudomonas aeruginosa]MCV4025140.1 hypothetical protein [Pseudomonas aeruginosa]